MSLGFWEVVVAGDIGLGGICIFKKYLKPCVWNGITYEGNIVRSHQALQDLEDNCS